MDQVSTVSVHGVEQYLWCNLVGRATDGGGGRGGWWSDWSEARLKEMSVNVICHDTDTVMNRDLLVDALRSKLRFQVKLEHRRCRGVFII
jgi:hypothetical protein